MNRWLVMIPVVLFAGCAAKEQARTGRLVDLFYSHEYPAFRDAVRRAAADRGSANVVIDNLRLGIASLADGDPVDVLFDHEAMQAASLRQTSLQAYAMRHGLRVLDVDSLLRISSG